MYITQKFKFIGQNLTKLVVPIIRDQKILRYANYLEEANPLSENLPDIKKSLTQLGIIRFAPFDENILTELDMKLFLNPIKSQMNSQPLKKPLVKDIYELDIVCPTKYWIIEGSGELRAYILAYEIASKIDGKNIAGMGDVKIVDWKGFSLKSNHAGLSIFIEVTNSAIGMAGDE